MTEDARRLLTQRLETDPDSVERDLFKLVLTIIELVRQLMEAQALRRVDEGDLSEDQIEALGLGLSRLEDAMEDLKGGTTSLQPTSTSIWAPSGRCCPSPDPAVSGGATGTSR